jgi:hypothetical protein
MQAVAGGLQEIAEISSGIEHVELAGGRLQDGGWKSAQGEGQRPSKEGLGRLVPEGDDHGRGAASASAPDGGAL